MGSSNICTRFQHFKFYEIFMAQKLHFPIFLSFDSPYMQRSREVCYEERSQRCPHAPLFRFVQKSQRQALLCSTGIICAHSGCDDNVDRLTKTCTKVFSSYSYCV